LGAGNNRQSGEGAPKHYKNDYQIFSNGKNINFESFEGKNTIDMFFTGLQHCFEAYSNEFSTFKRHSYKLQQHENAKDLYGRWLPYMAR
jgi:hypothetical protein